MIFIVILVVQKLLAKFVFLQDSGAYLALDNRYTSVQRWGELKVVFCVCNMIWNANPIRSFACLLPFSTNYMFVCWLESQVLGEPQTHPFTHSSLAFLERIDFMQERSRTSLKTLNVISEKITSYNRICVLPVFKNYQIMLMALHFLLFALKKYIVNLLF